ncbi:hypothetical protein Bbelb_019550 [Branchiostoma belcheri]|nr:hypothetical protein Bbelb_019550 [Branchiostoma belcheri]
MAGYGTCGILRYPAQLFRSLRKDATPQDQALRSTLRSLDILRPKSRPRGCKAAASNQFGTTKGNMPVSVHAENTSYRSLLNKMDEFQLVLSTSAIDVAVVTETWFTPSLPLGATDIPNFNQFSKCRSDRRGGGVAVYTKHTIPSKPLDVAVPTELECVWVHLRPHWLPRSVSSIALCAVYHPPNSTSDNALLDFLSDSIDDVRRQYPGVGVVVLGYLNHLDVSTICHEHFLKPVVSVPTRENAILDQVLASEALTKCYQPPTTVPPVGASDHNCVVWSGVSGSRVRNKMVKKVVRPLRQSGVRLFGSWITQHHWEEVYSAVSATDKCSAFYSTLSRAMDKYLPSKVVRLHERDKPWMTPALKAMILKRQKVFKEQNVPEVRRLRNKIANTICMLKKNFYKTKVKHLRTADPKKWYKAIKDMAGKNGELQIDVPGVPSSSPKAVADAINAHLSAASQQHAPLQPQELPAYLPAPAPPPTVSFWDMWHRLRMVKIGKATGNDDVSPRIVREFAFELSQPLCDIMNTSLNQGVVPGTWRDADVVPVPKEMPPRLTKLRPISLTSVFAKVCEGFVTDWCLRDILPRVDNRQFGSLRGRSTTHYMALLTHKLLEAADKPGHATTLVLTDFSRAFDSVHHNTAISKLIDLGVRPSLVPWISSFISGRRQSVRYQGVVSDWEMLTCGKASGRLYMLRSLKKQGLDTHDLVLIYIGFVRPVLEYCCQVWHPGLTVAEYETIERVQRRACRIILGQDFTHYNTALQDLSLDPLALRRCDLCRNFARSLLKSPDFRKWLPPRREKISGRTTRSSNQLNTYKTRTVRFAKSPIMYATTLLNEELRSALDAPQIQARRKRLERLIIGIASLSRMRYQGEQMTIIQTQEARHMSLTYLIDAEHYHRPGNHPKQEVALHQHHLQGAGGQNIKYSDGNPWQCDCRMAPVKHINALKNQIICAQPAKLQGQKLENAVIWKMRRARNPPLGLNPGVVGSNTNTAASVMVSGHRQGGLGQSQAITASTTNTTATVMTSGDDHQYEDIDNPRVKTGEGQSQTITESNTNTKATVMASGDDQTGNGQSQAVTESLDVRNLSYGTGQTASQQNSVYKAVA